MRYLYKRVKRYPNIVLGILLVTFGLSWYLLNPFKRELSLSNISAISLGGEMPLSELFSDKTVLYFGYVSCPLICPMTMATISEALKEYDQNNTRVIFISLSSLDDFNTTHTYVQGYHSNIIGVDITAQDIEKLTAWLKVQYQYLENGEINHSGNLYLFKQQELVKVLPFGVETETIVQVLKRI
jgi:protein SCO1/2